MLLGCFGNLSVGSSFRMVVCGKSKDSCREGLQSRGFPCELQDILFFWFKRLYFASVEITEIYGVSSHYEVKHGKGCLPVATSTLDGLSQKVHKVRRAKVSGNER